MNCMTFVNQTGKNKSSGFYIKKVKFGLGREGSRNFVDFL